MFRALTGRRTRSQRVAAVSPAGASVSDVNARADPMDDGASVESTTADRPPPDDDDDDDDSSLGLGLTGAAATARSRRSAREADNNGDDSSLEDEDESLEDDADEEEAAAQRRAREGEAAGQRIIEFSRMARANAARQRMLLEQEAAQHDMDDGFDDDASDNAWLGQRDAGNNEDAVQRRARAEAAREEEAARQRTIAASQRERANAARQRMLNQLGAQASSSWQQELDAIADADPDFPDNCAIEGVAPRDPVLWGHENHVFGRRALSNYVERNTVGDSVSHPITRRMYLIEEFIENIREVTGDRLQRILAERERLGLGNDPDSSDDDDDLPAPRRRRTENGRVDVQQPQQQPQQQRPQQERRPLGEFLRRGVNPPQMRTTHEEPFMQFAHTASATEDGLRGTLGYGNRRAFFIAHTDSLFSSTGPFAGFVPVASRSLQDKIASVITAARCYYDMDHSNAIGARMENIPRWARILFPIFDGNSERDNERREHHAVAHGLMGAQAPLGQNQINAGVQQLRNERSRNNGAPELRQRTVGQVDVDRQLVEGRDDRANRRAPQASNGRTRHRNALLTGQMDEFASRHAAALHDGFHALNRLVEGVNQAVIQGPSRPVRDIINDIRETLHDMRNAPPEMRADLNIALSALRAELREQNPDAGAANVGGGDNEGADEN